MIPVIPTKATIIPGISVPAFIHKKALKTITTNSIAVIMMAEVAFTSFLKFYRQYPLLYKIGRPKAGYDLHQKIQILT